MHSKWCSCASFLCLCPNVHISVNHATFYILKITRRQLKFFIYSQVVDKLWEHNKLHRDMFFLKTGTPLSLKFSIRKLWGKTEAEQEFSKMCNSPRILHGFFVNFHRIKRGNVIMSFLLFQVSACSMIPLLLLLFAVFLAFNPLLSSLTVTGPPPNIHK